MISFFIFIFTEDKFKSHECCITCQEYITLGGESGLPSSAHLPSNSYCKWFCGVCQIAINQQCMFVQKTYNFLKRFYLFIFRERKGGRKRGREPSICGCLLCVPYWGPGLQPRHVPWLGMELVTFCFAGRHSIHWITPARVNPQFFKRHPTELKYSLQWV